MFKNYRERRALEKQIYYNKLQMEIEMQKLILLAVGDVRVTVAVEPLIILWRETWE